MIKQAKELIEKYGFKVGESHCAIEAKPPVHWNKGRASIYILRTAFGLDWTERIRIIYVGDDNTDEDAMTVCFLCLFIFLLIFCLIKRTSINFINIFSLYSCMSC